jgi:hypothetical protein
MFKQIFTAAFAVSALAAASSAHAQNAPVADLAIGGGFAALEGAPAGTSVWNLNTLGRGNIPLGMMGWNVEVQAGGKTYFAFQGLNSAGVPIQADVYGHLWKRGQNAAFGLVVGIAPQSAVFTSVGGELKVYTPRASFGGAAAATFLPASGTTYSGWTFNGALNFFLRPDIRLGLRGAVLDFTNAPSPLSTGAWEVGFDYEQRLPGAPISLWLGVTRGEGLTGQYKAWRTEAGVRFFLDQPKSTLQSHDRDVPFTLVVPLLYPL